MRILFISDLHYLPQHRGGTQSLMHELALELLARGHEPAVLAPLHPDGVIGLRDRAMFKLLGRDTVRDEVMGYPVYRRWRVSGPLDAPVAAIRPDAAIVMPRAAVPMAAELRRLGVPVVVYFQDVEFQQLGGDPRELGEDVVFAANSEYTARRCREAFGLRCAVVPPLVRAERYRTERKPANVTMINPHPLKGGDLALDVAEACPQIPFSLVSCWVLPPDLRRKLEARVERLSNVTLRPATRDMKRVYARARILLAPSRWEEAWGRVATEAQFSGIPVVASDRGGLRESVGPGGVLLDPDGPVEPWIEAVRRLWSDEAYYRLKSDAAVAYAQRLAIEPGRLVMGLLALVRAAGARARLDGIRNHQKTTPPMAAGVI
jgi:glycosyltransferase involved in cell wall biosynthesis